MAARPRLVEAGRVFNLSRGGSIEIRNRGIVGVERLQALYTYNAAVAEFDRATATEVKYSACVDEPGTRSKLRTAAKPTPAPKPTPLPLNGDCAPAKVMRTGTKVESSLAK